MNIPEIFQNLEYGPAPEVDGEAIAWLEAHNREFGSFIDGEFSKPGKGLLSVNPANGEVLAQITQTSKADIDRAVKAARKAHAGWQGLSGFERSKYLYAIARQVQKHARLFAVLESLDNGKPIRESRDIDIPLVARHFYHHAGWATHIERVFPDHQPYGVCGQVIPWNFPLLMLAWKVAPALAAGNCVVLKPAEYTSLTALLFAQLCREIGLPNGVVNIITGDGEVGAAIMEHQDIDKVAFTGSTGVGKAIRSATAGSGKGISLELGGKSPFIVFDDADIDSAIEGLVDAIWFNQGQVCCAGSRLLVQESIEKRFIKKLKARMAKLRVGDPLDKSIDIGALVAPVQVERVTDLMKKGEQEGAVRYQPDGALPEKGCFLKPTLFTHVSPANTIASEEIFGPVLVAMSFRTPDEAVELANNSKYGLAASIWTENINLALDVAPRVKAGVVWVNSTNQFDAACGFGGYKESGYGREGGKEGMAAYLRPAWETKLKPLPPAPKTETPKLFAMDGIDRTAKLYIGGKQVRPDSGYARVVVGPDGKKIGEVGEGNRKDIRNAVEAARASLGWGQKPAHLRAQILYYMGENLDYRRAEFADRIRLMTGVSANAAKREVDLSIERLFAFAGWADKYDGAVHNPPMRAMSVAMVEPIGVVGITAPAEAPLLGTISLLAPTVAMGNSAVLVASETAPLAMTDFYQILETSDMPGGVVNIVTGEREVLTQTLAEHDGVDALLYVGDAQGCKRLEKLSIYNLKQTWTNKAKAIDWADKNICESDYFLARTTQIKNVWVPYGA